MKMTRVVLTLILVAALSLSLPGATSLAREVFPNDSVIQMVKAGLPEAVVIAKIKSPSTKFDLKTDSLVSLKKAGVSDKVLEAMVAAGSGAAPSTAAAATPAPPAPALAAGALKTQDGASHLLGRKIGPEFPPPANLRTHIALFPGKSEEGLEG